MTKADHTIEQRPLADIQPYGKNAKKHPEDQVMAIANSIREFGFNQPIVVDKAGVIIVGHGRYLAATLLGLEKVPVITVDIDEEKVRAYRLADNKLNESPWDMDLVIQELKTLAMPMIDLTGFERRLVLEDDRKDDTVPAMPKTPKSKYGDLYQLGEHKILCGDATKEEDWLKLMTTIKADMVFTDPPYNVDYKGGGKNTSQGIMNDKMEDAVFIQFLASCFKNMRAYTKAGAGMYVFHSSSTQKEFEQALNSADIEVRTQLIWNKPSAGLGMGHYRAKHEPFFYAHAKGTDPNFYGDRTHSTIVDFQKTEAQLASWAKKQKQLEKEGIMSIWTMKREPVQDYVHPTQKPVELVMYALHNSSKVEDIVLDPFLGSGATLIACTKTNRILHGMELDPKFVDVIVQRWVEYTGNKEIIKNGEKITW